MKEYKISLIRQIKALRYILIMLLIVIIFLVIDHLFGDKVDVDQLKATLLFYSVFLFPTLIVHIQFLIENKATKLIIDKRLKRILIGNSNNLYEFDFNEIDRIEMFLAPAQYFRNGFLNIPFDPYFYAKIILRQGSSHIVSCLMLDRQEDIEQLKSVKIIRYKRFLPLLE